MIAREVFRTRLKPGAAAQVPLDRWMLTNPKTRRRQNIAGFVESLKAAAGGKRKHVSEVKPRPVRRKKRK